MITEKSFYNYKMLPLLTLLFLSGCGIHRLTNKNHILSNRESCTASICAINSIRLSPDEQEAIKNRAKQAGVLFFSDDFLKINDYKSQNIYIVDYRIRGSAHSVSRIMWSLYVNNYWEVSDAILDDNNEYTLVASKKNASICFIIKQLQGCCDKNSDPCVDVHCVVEKK